jgi:excisionase family DNA binding protein
MNPVCVQTVLIPPAHGETQEQEQMQDYSPIGDVLLDRAAAAQYCNMTERWVQRQLNDGLIPKLKMGNLVRIRKSDLDAYLAACRTPARRGPLAEQATEDQPAVATSAVRRCPAHRAKGAGK